MARGARDHRLLVLGMLHMQDMHGYQIAEVIESHFGDDVHIKRATLYDTLKKLADEGLVTSHEEQQGNRPTRTVYALTEQGKRDFAELLSDSVGQYDPAHAYGDVGLVFLDALSASDAVGLLAVRRDTVMRHLEANPEDDPHHGAMRMVDARHLLHARAEIEWLDSAIAELESAENGECDE